MAGADARARGLTAGREVIFEHRRIGDLVRVAAVDVQTGLEVVIQGPANAAQAYLEEIALKKLARALEAGERAPAAPKPGKMF